MRSFGSLWESRPVQPAGGAVMQPVRGIDRSVLRMPQGCPLQGAPALYPDVCVIFADKMVGFA